MVTSKVCMQKRNVTSIMDISIRPSPFSKTCTVCATHWKLRTKRVSQPFKTSKFIHLTILGFVNQIFGCLANKMIVNNVDSNIIIEIGNRMIAFFGME